MLSEIPKIGFRGNKKYIYKTALNDPIQLIRTSYAIYTRLYAYTNRTTVGILMLAMCSASWLLRITFDWQS